MPDWGLTANFGRILSMRFIRIATSYLAMNVVEKHTSPDGFLRLIVVREVDGAIAFDGYSWHTHGDILASLSELSESEAIRQFVEQIIRDEQIIVVSRVNGEVQDIWPTDDPSGEFKYKPPEESLEFRRWSGLAVEVEAS